MPDSNDPNYTLSFDLLGVSEEWIMGGQRINDYEMLLENIKKWGNKPKISKYIFSHSNMECLPKAVLQWGLSE